MNENLAPKMVRYVAVSSALAKKALDLLGVHQLDGEKAAALRPDLLQQMLDTETLGSHQKEAAEVMLATHEGSVQLLRNAIVKIAELSKNQKKAGDLGQGVDPSVIAGGSPEASGLNPNYLGQKTGEKKASDLALFNGLGIGSTAPA